MPAKTCGALFVIAAFGVVTIAPAAEIAEPKHKVAIAYDEPIWSASSDDRRVTLKCKVNSCGGADAECDTFTSDAKNGVAPKQFFWDFLGEFTPKTKDAFEDNGYDPEVVDAAASFYEDARLVGLSSIDFMQGSVKKRAWFAEIGEPFGVIVLQCYAAKSQFTASKAQWFRLMGGVAGPKP